MLPRGATMMTADQQVQAFLTHCSTLRQGYFFSFKKNSSSLRGLIRLLEAAKNSPKAQLEQGELDILAALNAKSPKDHVKYKPAIKSIIAVWGTTNDYVPLAANQAQATTVKYWRPAQPMTDVPCGIAIASRYPGYHEHVGTHLNALYQTAAGRTVLDALGGAAATKRTSIVDHTLSNQCGSNGLTQGMDAVARELYSDLSTTFGAETLAALNRVNPGTATRNAWLAEKVNATPRYQLKGVPATTRCDLGVTEGQVAAWVGGQSIWDDYGNDRDCNQIKA